MAVYEKKGLPSSWKKIMTSRSLKIQTPICSLNWDFSVGKCIRTGAESFQSLSAAGWFSAQSVKPGAVNSNFETPKPLTANLKLKNTPNT